MRANLDEKLDSWLSSHPSLNDAVKSSRGYGRIVGNANAMRALVSITKFPGHVLNFFFYAGYNDTEDDLPQYNATLQTMQTETDKLSAAYNNDPGSIAPPAAEEKPYKTAQNWSYGDLDSHSQDTNTFAMYLLAHGSLFDAAAPFVMIFGGMLLFEVQPVWLASIMFPALLYFCMRAWTTMAQKGMLKVDMESSRLQISLIVAVTVASGIRFKYVLYPVLSDLTTLCFIQSVAFVVTPIFHAITTYTDPGTVTGTQLECQEAFREGKLCTTCKTPRKLRSKHCRVCGKCVPRFDHHCPVVYNCVGLGNQKYFVIFIFCMWVGQACYITCSVRYLLRVGAMGHHGFLSQLWHFIAADPYSLFLGFFQALGIMGNTFLCVRAGINAAANLTVNESMNLPRYAYLFDDGQTYHNPFDVGPLTNCIEFFYAPDRQRDWDHLAEKNARDSPQREAPPACSVVACTNLYRSVFAKKKGAGGCCEHAHGPGGHGHAHGDVERDPGCIGGSAAGTTPAPARGHVSSSAAGSGGAGALLGGSGGSTSAASLAAAAALAAGGGGGALASAQSVMAEAEKKGFLSTEQAAEAKAVLFSLSTQGQSSSHADSPTATVAAAASLSNDPAPSSTGTATPAGLGGMALGAKPRAKAKKASTSDAQKETTDTTALLSGD